jgi:hypothetical protein
MRKTITLLLLNLIFAFQLQAQGPCKDTLKWSVCGIFDRADKFNDVDGKVYNIKKDSMLLLLFCITNVSNELYPAGSIIECKFNLKHYDNDIFNDSIYYSLKKDFYPTDSTGFMLFEFDIPLYLLSLGKYSYKMLIKGTDLDGEFCDSIQTLSSFTATFDLVDGSGINSYNELNVNIYPIPANSTIEIISNDIIINEAVLFDITGSRIRKFIINDFTSTLDVSDVNNGMYYIMLSTEKGMFTHKIIIKRT